MSFFNQFPLSQINVGNQPKQIVDLFRHVDVNDVLADNVTSYLKTIVRDGERPDNLSQRVYGTPDYYWTFFIVNESLKNGLDDWPKSYAAIEKEFQNEYDTISTFTINPRMETQIVDAGNSLFSLSGNLAKININHISNTLAGLDLTYSGLKIFRNFSTASIVKYDDNELQLYLDNFSDRRRFMLDMNVEADFNTIRAIEYLNSETISGAGATGNIQFPGTFINKQNLNGRMSFTFEDWPILGENGENMVRVGDGLAHESRGDFYLDTMTPERVEWCVELFKWFDTTVVGQGDTETGIGISGLPYRDFLNDVGEKGRAQAALDMFNSYFTPWPANGNMKWNGILPYRQPDTGLEHSFLSARNAPCYYYKTGGGKFVQEDIISPFEMINGTSDATSYSPENDIPSDRETYTKIGQDYNNYVSHYEKAINMNEVKSQIKVIRPDLISAFAQEFKKKLNQGLTRTAGATLSGVTGIAAQTGGGATSGATGTTTGGASSGGGTGGGYGGGGSTGGGGGY